MEHWTKTINRKNMENETNKKRRPHWTLKLIIPVIILLISGAFLYAGYFGPEGNSLSTINQIIWWVFFAYSLIRIISILIKKS